jgi:hypothetical protein
MESIASLLLAVAFQVYRSLWMGLALEVSDRITFSEAPLDGGAAI